MRTTVKISEQPLEAARRRARQSGRTLGAVIDAALRRELSAADGSPAPPAVPVFSGGTGPRPGIDFRSNRAMHEALDEDQSLDRMR